MCDSRGLAAVSRENRLRVVQRFPVGKFAGRPLNLDQFERFASALEHGYAAAARPQA